MDKTKTFFCWLLFGLLTLSACADEDGVGRKWCHKAAQVAGSLCLKGKPGEDGDVRIRISATSDVTAVDLTELGGPADAPRDGTPKTVQPGTGKVFWNSDNITHFLTITLNATTGSSGLYAPLVRPSVSARKGVTRTFMLFLSGDEYAFFLPE